jgi:hypothetical protein
MRVTIPLYSRKFPWHPSAHIELNSSGKTSIHYSGKQTMSYSVAFLSSFNLLKVHWSLYVRPGITFNNSTFCPYIVFMCFVRISGQTAIISLYSINWLVFMTEMESVYCAVRAEYLYIIQTNLSWLKVMKKDIITYTSLRNRPCKFFTLNQPFMSLIFEYA